MAWLYILIILTQTSNLREELFLSNPQKYRIYYYSLRSEFLKEKKFEKLYKISKKAVETLGKVYTYYADFLLSRHLTGRKTETLIDSINTFFNEENIKRILFLFLNSKYYDIAEKTVFHLRKLNKNENLYSEILYRIYIEKKDFVKAFRELKKFENKNLIKIELKRISKEIDFERIEKEFKDNEEFYPVLAEIALFKNLNEKAINYFIKSKDEKRIREYIDKNPGYIIKFTEKEKDPLILFYRARAFERKRDYKRALEIYKEIEGKIKKIEDEINYSISKIYLKERNLDEAEKRIGKIKDENKRKVLMAIYNLLKGKPKENYSILKDMKTADGLFYLSLSFYFSKDFTKAETTFFKFVEGFPEDERVPDVLFLSYLLLNFKDEVEKYAEVHYKIFKGEEVKPPSAGGKVDFLYNFLYAGYLKEKGKFEESLEIFKKISEGEDIPEIIKVKSMIEMAEIYKRKNKKEAERIYKEILIKYPESPFSPYVQRKLKEI